MKRTILTVAVTILMLSVADAQKTSDNQGRNYVTGGVGYFGEVLYYLSPLEEGPNEINPDINSIHGGIAQFLEFGHKMDNGYNIAGRFTMAEVKLPYYEIDQQFWNKEFSEIYYIVELVFNYDFAFGKHTLTPGSGLLFRHIYSSNAYFGTSDQVNGIMWVAAPDIEEITYNDIGLSLNLDYCYNFSTSFYAGVHLGSNIIMGIGIETITFSPLIGVRF